MAHLTLTDARILLDGYDLSGDMNEVGVDRRVAEVSDTMFGSDTEVLAAGTVKQVAFEAAGHWDVAADVHLFSRLGGSNKPIVYSAEGGDDGDRAYALRAMQASYVPGEGSHGEMLKFSVSARGEDDPVRGTIMLNGASLTATGSGTARQLGAASSAQTLFACLQVLAVSGTAPTLDVTVKSDDASGFLSPVTQVTFAQATGVTAEWATAAGPITDTWWRVDYTIGGTSPSFDFVVFVGIQ